MQSTPGKSDMTICLAMIVKNEAAVIKRCIGSVMPIINDWVICDTGSTDETREIISRVPRDFPGKGIDRPWVDFATNRGETLAYARETGADYALMMDADDTLEVPAGFVMPELTADSYTVDFHFGGMRYRRAALFANRLPWTYRGVVHEFPYCAEAKTQGHLPLIVHVGNDGARRQDPLKYHKDAAVLEKALETEQDPFLRTRYTFYLGQSWRDAGEPMKAIAAYRQRAGMGGWQEEVYVSLLNIARMKEALGRDDVITAYLAAVDASATRGEALYKAAHLFRMRRNFGMAYQIALLGVDRPAPPDGLFVETWVHEYGLLDELAVSAYWYGLYRESVDACEILLSEGKGPDRARYIANANFARRKLLSRV